jgi:hypothetical protein
MYGFLDDDFIASHTPLNVWWDRVAAVSLFLVLSGFVSCLKYFGHAGSSKAPGFCTTAWSSRKPGPWLSNSFFPSLCLSRP